MNEGLYITLMWLAVFGGYAVEIISNDTAGVLYIIAFILTILAIFCAGDDPKEKP